MQYEQWLVCVRGQLKPKMPGPFLLPVQSWLYCSFRRFETPAPYASRSRQVSEHGSDVCSKSCSCGLGRQELGERRKWQRPGDLRVKREKFKWDDECSQKLPIELWPLGTVVWSEWRTMRTPLWIANCASQAASRCQSLVTKSSWLSGTPLKGASKMVYTRIIAI